MAYMSKALTAKIRSELKAAFPQFKLSVTNDDYRGINVAIMEGSVEFDIEKSSYIQINHYHAEKYINGDILVAMLKIINQENYDRSDAQSDYFDIGYFVHLSVGKWDKPYKLKSK